MAQLPLPCSDVVALVGVGTPPAAADPGASRLADWIIVAVMLDLTIYLSVRLLSWLDPKISSIKLPLDLERELGIGSDRRGRERDDR